MNKELDWMKRLNMKDYKYLVQVGDIRMCDIIERIVKRERQKVIDDVKKRKTGKN